MRKIKSVKNYPVGVKKVPGLWLLRCTGVVTILVSLNYLRWRVTAHTINPSTPFFAWAFFVAECVACLNLLVLILICWQGVVRIPTPLKDFNPPLPSEHIPSVDIFIPTLNESLEIVERTVMAALAIDYPPEKATVHILDDGGREDLRQWALSRKVAGDRLLYIARKKAPGTPDYAKAGNLNHALFEAGTHGDFMLLLDADHIASKDIVQKLLPYFYEYEPETRSYASNRVAFAQAPDRSWTNFKGNYLADDTVFFNGPMQQSNDALGAVWMVTTAVLIRRKAIEEIGGFFKYSITEDVPTGFILHSYGWQSRFHSEPLTLGMPPVSFATMLRQRQRWIEGELQHYLKVLPKVFGRLNWKQRLSYLAGPINRAASLIFLLGCVFLPYLAISSGKAVFSVAPLKLAGYFIPYLLLTRLARLVAYRSVSPWRFFRNEQIYFCSAATLLIAFFRVLCLPGKIKFWVSPKDKRSVARNENFYTWSRFLLPLPFLYALWKTVPLMKWPLALTLCANNSLVTLIWQIHFLLGTLPILSCALFPPRVCADYFKDTREDQILAGNRWWDWLFLPTNLAPAITILVCLGTLGVSFLLGKSICDCLR